MPSPRTTARIFVTAVIVLVLTGCYQVQQPKHVTNRPNRTNAAIGDRLVTDGGKLVMGLSEEPDKLDPTTSSSLYTRYVMNSVCEKLYDTNAKNKIVPQLASGMPKLADGGRTVTIPLRDGITFADGTAFNAKAVRTSLHRHLHKKGTARASEMGPITSISAPDKHTVRLRFKKPFAPITAALADRAGMIMSPRALKRLGDNFGSAPVCVGPFKFAKRVPQTSITVKKDPHYYAADRVHLDRITYRIMTDASIRAANLRSGDVDVVDTVSPQDIDALKREDDIGILQTGSLGYQGVTFNIGNTNGTGKPPGKINTPVASKRKVRSAFSHAVDRKALVDSVFNNWFEPACSPIAPSTQFATKSSNACPKYDPATSRRLLREAGVKLPLKITMQVTNTPDTVRLAQALQAAVRDGGFDLKITPVEYTTLLDTQTAGKFSALQLGWSGRVDPHGNMFPFLATREGNNYSGYTNSTVDRLLHRATRQVKPARRAKTYSRALKIVRRDNPIVYLYRQRNLTAYNSDRIAGVSVYPDGIVRLSRAAFLKDSS